MSIATEISRIQSAKADIKAAIEAKGVTVPSSATIDTYDDYVSQISGGGGGITMPSNLSAATLNDYGLLTSAAIKSGVTSISSNAFNNCRSLTSVTIPDSVTSIGSNAFSNCSNLINVTIPNSVASIGDTAFSNCKYLSSITVNAATPPTIGRNVFNASKCPIYVPAQSVDAYKSATNWSAYASRIQAIPT